MSAREGTFYLTVRPGRYSWELRTDKVTGRKPRTTPEGSVVVKLKIRIPDAAFRPLEPSIIVDVPEDMLVSGDDVTVEAVPSE